MDKGKIGLIVAVEIDAVLKKYNNITKVNDDVYDIWCIDNDNNYIYVVKSGVGEIYASASTQYLITKYGVQLIVNFGIAGALTSDMANNAVCIVDKVVHYDIDTSEVDNIEVGRYLDYPDVFIPATADLVARATQVVGDLPVVTCASADKFVADPVRKQQLHTTYGADVCEMEAAGIVLTCNRNHIPCLIIKSIADTLFGGAGEYWDRLSEASDICVHIVDRIIAELQI